MVAETTPDNAGMLAIFRHAGFELEYKGEDGIVLVERSI